MRPPGISSSFVPTSPLTVNVWLQLPVFASNIRLFSFLATSCRGYLNKVGAKPLFSNLRANNRWFVFDRERQMLVYYSDKNEKKPRGGAYFNAITDVYFDHSTAMKNNRTFIVKTKNRMYTLQAPSQQACTIWIDVGSDLIRCQEMKLTSAFLYLQVIITGAQGKMLEYDK